MKTRFSDSDDYINVWPSFTDMNFMIILVLFFIIILQHITEQDVFKMETIAGRKKEVWNAIRDAFPVQTDDSIQIITKNDESPQMLTIHFSNKILFPLGKADSDTIKEEGKRILQALAGVIVNFDGYFREIKVQGHTDNVPYTNVEEVYSNWDLSSDRATKVVKTIISGMPQEKRKEYEKLLVAAGYSEYKPRADNLFDEKGKPKGNEMNRRIDIEFEFEYESTLG